MALYLVGENIDKTRSHYLAETGRILQLMRGIYVDANDDADAVVLAHAIRIARYLYPQTYLSAATAIALAPTRDGRLFLSGKRNLRTRIRALEIIQNTGPKSPSLAAAVVGDSFGEFHVKVSSIRQRFLEAFRVRSEHAASIDEEGRAAGAARLIEEYGDAAAASDAEWALARENGWLKEGEAAERFLKQKHGGTAPTNTAALDLVVAWHGVPLGELHHDGFEWRWTPVPDTELPVIRQTTPGLLPPFIVSLLPEGWLGKVLNDPDERAALRSGKRYLSNITIAPTREALARLPADVLTVRLAQFTIGDVFTGTYNGPGSADMARTFEENLARIYASTDTPRLSGVQIKAPMNLAQNGVVSPATELPFTHILKPAGTGGFENLPLIEWACLKLGKAVGFDVPATALVPMPGGMPPALLVERFDIREGAADTRRLVMEDMCSVLSLPPERKYDGTMERVGRAVRPLSTDPEADLVVILKRTLFAWLIADGDMHLKNMALLKIADAGGISFSSVRFAPLYDAVTTRVFPRLAEDRMALNVNGKDARLRRADFKAMALTVGMTVAAADAAIDEALERLREGLTRIALPGGLAISTDAQTAFDRMLEIARERTGEFA